MAGRSLLVLLCIAFLISSCTQVSRTPVPTIAPYQPNPLALYNAVIEKIDCPFSLPADVDPAWVDCNHLVVPEDRGQADGRKVKIAYLILKTPSSTPKTDPLLILYTRPSQQLDISLSFAYSLGATLFRDRDAVVVDVRGAGFSEPSFSCPELNDLYLERLEASPDDPLMWDRWVDTEKTCYQAWQSKGYDLNHYSTTDIAADLEDLRQAAGYTQWNIIGAGYGTRLAYSLARDYPQSIRSVVLDEPEPFDGDVFTEQAQNWERIIDLVLDGCAADKSCNQAFPNTKKIFYQLIDDLNSMPARMEVTNLQNGLRYPMVVNGNRFLEVVIDAITYDGPRYIPEIPRMIAQAKQGNYRKLAEMLGSRISANEPLDTLMQDRINCVERVFPMSSQSIQSANQDVNTQIATVTNEQYQLLERGCHQIFEDLVTGDQTRTELAYTAGLPTLMILGEQNGFVAPEPIKAVAKRLENSIYLEISQQGATDWLYNPISVTGKSCITPIVTGFILDPSKDLNIDCVANRLPISWVTLP
jgi:pimeloyl-ACP methyl ester carboxylesterase